MRTSILTVALSLASVALSIPVSTKPASKCRPSSNPQPVNNGTTTVSSSSTSQTIISSSSISTGISSTSLQTTSSAITLTTSSAATTTTAAATTTTTTLTTSSKATQSSSTSTLETVSSTTSETTLSSTSVQTTSSTSSQVVTATTSSSSTITSSTATTSTTSSVPTNCNSNAAVTNAIGLSWYSPLLTVGHAQRPDPSGGYQCYSGPASNFPTMDQWVAFDQMFDLMTTDALQKVNDTSDEIAYIKSGIIDVSQIAKVDARVILAMIIKESTGNVRVKCTANGVQNCGLMQSYNPDDKSYDPSNAKASIRQMIQDGTQGTCSGPGMVQDFNDPASKGNVYAALRLYNSGHIAPGGDLSNSAGATANYVSDIANYLTGWNGYGTGSGVCNFS